MWLLKTFGRMIQKRHTYRNSEATTSILTITSNVVRQVHRRSAGWPRRLRPVCPGTPAGAEQNSLLASLNSVAKLPYTGHWTASQHPDHQS